ncbi:MAG TPA: MFS transporter [Vicinamibacterales bacterium]
MTRARLALFTVLYAAEGAPIGFIWWALPTVLREAGLPIERITGLTALVLLPWVFKFAWAPAIDVLRTRWWGFRAWIIAAQGLMGLTLLPLLWLDPVLHFEVWRALLLLHAVAAATQDVAIDALAINSVPVEHRGLLNGCMQAGMLTGRSLFGGGALLVAGLFGRNLILVLLITWIWLALVAVAFAAEPETGSAVHSDPRTFRSTLFDALRRRTTWLGLAFALTSAAAFEATGQLAGPFLVDRGVPSATIGLFFGIPVVAAMLLGGLLGGVLADRWGRRRSIVTFLTGFVLTIVLLAAQETASPWILALLTAMYFFVGLFTVASYALFMDLTDPRLGGTQFSTYMAATNGCEAWSTWVGGRIAGSAGYSSAFTVMSVVSLLSLALVRWMPIGVRTPAPAITGHPSPGR